MIRFLVIILTVLLSALPARAGTKSLTCYLDGGRVSQVISARRGSAEITLPRDLVPGSLRVRPLAGAVISRVQPEPAKVDAKAEKALAALDERKELLGDRLKALETREDIFKAAAKTQSAKAPRKSKANPEPVTAIRQGTDFALTRLEEVYRSRRATEKELKVLEVKREELAKKANVGGSVARIRLQGRDGAVSVEYQVAGGAWKPAYDFRLDGSPTATVTLRALLPEVEQGTAVAVVAARLAVPETNDTQPMPAGGDYAAVATYALPVTATVPASAVSPLTFTLANATDRSLPSGDGACFWKGEYFGTTVFGGVAPGGTLELACGRPPAVSAATPSEKR
jgi:N-terminal domain of unknown function (DUF4140)